MEETRSDAELLARASRQPDLFGVVFDRHFATIHRYLERRVGRDGADELSSEVFRIAFEQRVRFRPVHQSALPWLYGLATNLALKRWRGDARHSRALGRLEAESRTGEPGDLDGADDRLILRQLTDELMYDVRALSGQDYVDEYATRKHEAMPSQPTAIVLDRGNGGRAERVATGSGAVGAAR